MDLKYVGSRIALHFRDNADLVRKRIFGSNVAFWYFVYSLVHCLLQVALQFAALAFNADGSHLLTHILDEAHADMRKFAYLGSDNKLRLCTGIPGSYEGVCQIVWGDGNGDPGSAESHGPEQDPGVTTVSSSAVLTTASSQATTRSQISTSQSVPLSTSTASSDPATFSSSSTIQSTQAEPTASTTSVSDSPSTSSQAEETTSSVESSSEPAPEPTVTDSSEPPAPPESSTEPAPEPTIIDTPALPVIPKPDLPTITFTELPDLPTSIPTNDDDSDEDHDEDTAETAREQAQEALEKAREERQEALEKAREDAQEAAEKAREDAQDEVDDTTGIKIGLPDSTINIPGPLSKSTTDDSDEDEDDEDSDIARRRLGRRDDKTVIVQGVVVNSTVDGVNIFNLHDAPEGSVDVTFVDQQCINTLYWPVQEMRNAKQEDITFIGFQVWLFGISIVAILNESVPHIMAAFATHVLSTVWSAFQIAQTEEFKKQFGRIVSAGACNGVSLLMPRYWTERTDVEIAILALNVVALALSGYMSWKAIRLYGWQTYKFVGASRVVNHVYTSVLVLSILIQLGLFFLITSTGLWISELCMGPIAPWAEHRVIYIAVFTVSVLLIVPWVVSGWVAVRREKRKLVFGFLGLSATLMAIWILMLISQLYRWTFLTWPFFAAMSVFSAVLMFVTIVMGIVCRLNFGKGLCQQLNSARQSLQSNDSSTLKFDIIDEGYDEEKVAFPHPSGAPNLPQFAMAFGARPTVSDGGMTGSMSRAPSSLEASDESSLQYARSISSSEARSGVSRAPSAHSWMSGDDRRQLPSNGRRY